MSFGYELMGGRGGAAGVMRSEGDGRRISAQGLPPGAEAAVYLISGGRARRVFAAPADERGRMEALIPREGTAFVAADGRLMLYQTGDSPEEGFALASSALKKLLSPPSAPIPEKKPEPPPAADEETQAAAPLSDHPQEEAYSLRAPTRGEPVDELPFLHWPKGTEEIRAYFDALPPIAPFEAAGWRFVRLPSPLPGVAYCALGRYAAADRVTRLCYALPGVPQRPPTALPGYRYRPAKGGMGYWIAEREV